VAMLSEISTIISGVALLRMLFYPVPADKQKTFGILDDHAMRTSSKSSSSRLEGAPEKSRILHAGNCVFIKIARSIPDIAGIPTSDIRRSGGLTFAAANASRGEVKNFAEYPFIRRIAARLDPMTGSSSTTKTRGAELVNTYHLFRIPFP
jgi:hypothetical protein